VPDHDQTMARGGRPTATTADRAAGIPAISPRPVGARPAPCRQAIRRGTFASVKDLETAISAYIDGWNDLAHLFTWTKNADDIAHAGPSHRKRTSYTRNSYSTVWYSTA